MPIGNTAATIMATNNNDGQHLLLPLHWRLCIRPQGGRGCGVPFIPPNLFLGGCFGKKKNVASVNRIACCKYAITVVRISKQKCSSRRCPAHR